MSSFLSLTTDFTLSSDSLQRVYLTINNVLDSTIYTVTINGTDVYQYPDDAILLSDIDAYGVSVSVDSTAGYPDEGFLLINTEVMQYSIKSDTAFGVEDTQRGAIVTYIDTHEAGADVKLWRGVEEQNTV